MTHKPSAAALVNDPPLEPSFTPVVSSSGMGYAPFLELGQGGMAKILLARAVGPSGFNKLVVLKEMHTSLLEDEALHRMFVDEARLSARFNHPNLVQVQEVNPLAQPPYLVMEYLDGKPMSALRHVEGVTLGMRLCVISEVLTGLHYAHELAHYDGTPLGIVHRDVSPHNVFITYDGAVKVLDFGIAKNVTNSTRTEAGEVKGKLAYMAPEQLLGAEIDRRADVFSVGSLLWEAAVGKRMWDGVSEGTLMHRLISGEIPRPSEHAAVDPELEEIIVKATATRVEDRFATAEELRLELDAYIARAGEQCSLRQIGALLGRAFQEERRQLAEAINIALRDSLRPAGAPIEEVAEVASEAEFKPPSRAPLIAAAALLLLALVGFLVPRLWSADPAASSEPSALTPPAAPATPAAPAQVAPAVAPEADAPRAPSATPEGEPSAAPAASESSEETAKKKSKAPRAGVAAAKAAPAVAPPAAEPTPAATPAPAADRCTPPYYFSGGIKTYKPECL